MFQWLDSSLGDVSGAFRDFSATIERTADAGCYTYRLVVKRGGSEVYVSDADDVLLLSKAAALRQAERVVRCAMLDEVKQKHRREAVEGGR